jgi:hypothetical protein
MVRKEKFRYMMKKEKLPAVSDRRVNIKVLDHVGDVSVPSLKKQFLIFNDVGEYVYTQPLLEKSTWCKI